MLISTNRFLLNRISKVFFFVICSFIVSSCVFSSREWEDKQKEKQQATEKKKAADRSGVRYGVNEDYPIFILSTDFWENFKAYESKAATNSPSAVIVVILLGIVGLGIIKSRKATLRAFWFAVIGFMELYYFLFYQQHPAWFFSSTQPLWVKLTAAILVSSLVTLQLGMLSELDAPDGQEGNERAKAYDADLSMCASLFPIIVYVCGWIASRIFHFGWLTSITNCIGICILIVPMIYTKKVDKKRGLLSLLVRALPKALGYTGFLTVFSYCPFASIIGILISVLYSANKAEKTKVADLLVSLKTNPNDSETLRKLGNAYLYGKGVKKNIYTALNYLQQSAERGNAKAYYDMGCFHYNDKEVWKDNDKALTYAHKSFDLGYMDACILLSSLYHEVYSDYGKSFYYTMKGAAANIVLCEIRAGMSFEHGEGTVKDLVKAMYWYKKVADDEKASKKQRGFCSWRYGYLRYESGEKGEGRWYIKQAQRFGNEMAVKYGEEYLAR